MSEQFTPAHSVSPAPSRHLPGQSIRSRSGAVTGEKDTRYAAGISLAAALGGTLLGVNHAQ